jgi:excinuclease UvrABC nuclease subunit
MLLLMDLDRAGGRFQRSAVDRPVNDDYFVYLLLRNQKVVYVGKGRAPEYRLLCHSKKRFWVFNDMIETADGPYSEPEALQREKALIRCYQPVYNVQYRGKRTPIEPSHPYYLMFQAVEAARIEVQNSSPYLTPSGEFREMP